MCAMNDESDKKLDAFIKKSVSELGTEEPSAGFTESVMERVREVSAKSSATAYEPLLPARIWVPASLLILALIAIVLTGNWDQDIIQIPYLDFVQDLRVKRILNTQYFSSLDNINIHKNVVYAVLMLSVFLYVQIIYLKRRVQ